MTITNIAEARHFSLREVQRSTLTEEGGLSAELLCFEAGQRSEETPRDGATLYQVLEGEVLLHAGGERQRVGKGRLISVPAHTDHALENAGGGLLVVLAIRN